MSQDHVRLLTESAMVTQFEAETIIFHQGDIANRFYLIQHGRVNLETSSEGQKVLTLQTLGAGDVLGWSWLFAPYYWHFSARALEATEALFFYGTRLRESCELDPAFGYELMKRVAAVLMRRLQASIETSLRLAEARSETRPRVVE
jgi:CRP-like cAMP-binding protein